MKKEDVTLPKAKVENDDSQNDRVILINHKKISRYFIVPQY